MFRRHSVGKVRLESDAHHTQYNISDELSWMRETNLVIDGGYEVL